MKTRVEGNRHQELRYFDILITLDGAYGLSKAFYSFKICWAVRVDSLQR